MTHLFIQRPRRDTRHVMNLFSCVMLFCIVIPSCIYLQTAVASPTVVIDPSMPLLNVPFRVTAPLLQPRQVLFVSKSSTCELKETLGDMCTLSDNRTCEFTVTSKSVGVDAQYARVVPSLYICSNAVSYRIIESLQLHVIDAFPRFLFKDVTRVMTINKATPVGSLVGFFKDDSCKTSYPNIPPVTLGENRKVSITMSDDGAVFICARIPVKNGAKGELLTSYLPGATLLVVQRFSVPITQALRYRTEAFSFTGIYQFPTASLSRSEDCDPLLQAPVKGHKLYRINMPILVPKGDYYFCIGLQYYEEDRLYVPSDNLITVRQYGLQPHTMYTGLPTMMSFTLDAEESKSKDTMGLALSRSPDCKGEMIIDWNTAKNWTVLKSGTYYACIRGSVSEDASTALAANISVLNAPLVSLSRSPAVRGLDFAVTLNNLAVSNLGTITVGLSLTSECSRLVSEKRIVGTSRTVSLSVPWDAFDRMFLCVSTPLHTKESLNSEDIDRGYTYALQSFLTRSYHTHYAPLFAGKKESIKLDPDVVFSAGTRGVFARGDCSKTVGNTFSMNVPVLNEILFSEAGSYFLCVKVPQASSYVRISEFVVYGPVKLNPMSIVVGAPTDVSVSLVPPNAPVSIVASANCSSSKLVKGDADITGKVKLLRLSYATETNLTVCVGYRGSDSQSWSVMPVGVVAVTKVNVLPQAVVATYTNRLNFILPDKMSLSGFEAFIIRGGAASCEKFKGLKLPVQVPNKGQAFILYHFPDVAKWTVCLGKAGTTATEVGEIASMAPLHITTDPSSGAVGLPINMQFTGPLLSALTLTRFFVTDKAESCTRSTLEPPIVYGEGNMDASIGRAETFVMTQEGNLTVCIGYKDHMKEFFLFGGTINTVRFKSISRYAIRDALNNFTVFPLASGTALFLVPCSTGEMCIPPIAAKVCSQARRRYYTSSLVPLRGASVGQYVLCQEHSEKKAIAASDTLVSVVDPFVVSLVDAEVRQYKPANVTLSGGDVKTQSDPITVYTVPQGVACTEKDARREEFVFSTGVLNGRILVTKITPFVEKVQLCVKLSSADTFPSTVFDLLPYMTPATIITDRKMQIRSGTLKDGILAKLTAKADCEGNVMNHGPATVINYKSEMYVEGCLKNNRALGVVHYCESYDGGATYKYRGVMPLIRLRSCDLDSPAAIKPITVPPAKAIVDYGIDTKLLASPRISKTSDCKNIIHDRNGYLPQYNEVAEFFVCVNAKDNPDYVFTTDTPTLRVDNFKASPSSIVSRLSATTGVAMPQRLTLTYSTESTHTFLSHHRNCSGSFATASGLANKPPLVSLLLTGILGLKYVCVETAGGKLSPVAVVLVVNPPVASKTDPALVRGAPFRTTLRVVSESGQHLLYSLFPGEDSHFTFAHLYSHSFRGIFLSNDACESVLKGSNLVHVGNFGRVVLPTRTIPSGLTFLSLCAGTPAGNVTILTDIEVSSAIIFPSQFVLGANVDVYIPLSPNGVFHLRQEENCGGMDIVPPFVTNNEGHGTLSFKRTLGTGLPPAGKWMLCLKTGATMLKETTSNTEKWNISPNSLRSLVKIEAFNPVYYNIRGEDVVVGVPSVVALLDDLKTDNLLPGLSIDKSCKELGETYGSWRPLSKGSTKESRRVAIKAIEPASSVYLCAVTPINKSIVSVPFGGALRFVAFHNGFPSTVSRCEPTRMNSCALPGSPPSGAFVSVVRGDCCNIADRGKVVGRMTRTSDNQCSLEIDSTKVNDYPPNSEFSVCAWDVTDYSYCTTLGYVRVGNDACVKETGASSPVLSSGALIAVCVFAVVFGVLLIILLTCLAMECYRRRRLMKEVGYATSSQRSGSEVNPLALYSARNGNIFLGRGERLLFGPNAANFLGGSQPTITVATSTEQTVRNSSSRDVSPEVLRLNLWDGIECDERDQIALLEARNRYNLRLAFSEGLERIRLMEKERAVQFELSEDETNPLETRERDFTTVPVPSAPAESAVMGFNEVLKKENATMDTVSAVCYAVPVSIEQGKRTSLASSIDAMNYTTTQRFYDDWRFTLDNEAVRRQRIVNWEDEEWHTLVDMEFNAYLRLQQNTLPPPPPPLPQAVVLPFAFLPDQQTDDGDVCVGVEGNNVHGASGFFTPQVRYPADGDTVNVSHASLGMVATSSVVRKTSVIPEDEEEMISVGTNPSDLMTLLNNSGRNGSRSERLEDERHNCSSGTKKSSEHYVDPLDQINTEVEDVNVHEMSTLSRISERVKHKEHERSLQNDN